MSAFEEITRHVPPVELLLSDNQSHGAHERQKALVLRAERLANALEDASTDPSLRVIQEDDSVRVLDGLQEWLDSSDPASPSRRAALYVMIRLAACCKRLPRSLYVRDVDDPRVRDPSYVPTKMGGFADIFIATRRGQLVALKRLRTFDVREPDSLRSLCREALVWRQLNHPSILPFIGIDDVTFAPVSTEALLDSFSFPPLESVDDDGSQFQDNTSTLASPGFVCLVSPWMRRGTLKQFMATQDYAPARDLHRLLVEAAEGLEYLHAQKVVHGDVKDHNILIDDELHIRLCDFGLALVGDATQGRMTTTAHGFGSCNWMSPERIMAERHRRSTADDVYGFGCLGYYMFARHPPFHNLNETGAALKVLIGERPSRPEDELCFNETWALIESCWSHNADSRPNMSDVLSRLCDAVAARAAAPSSTVHVHPDSSVIHAQQAVPVGNDASVFEATTMVTGHAGTYDEHVLALHPILACASLYVNLSLPFLEESGVLGPAVQIQDPATRPPCFEMVLEIPALPLWPIDIIVSPSIAPPPELEDAAGERPSSIAGCCHMRPVTIQNIVEHLHSHLRVRVTLQEWMTLGSDEQASIQEAFQLRLQAASSGGIIEDDVQRVDFLRGNFIFRGLVPVSSLDCPSRWKVLLSAASETPSDHPSSSVPKDSMPLGRPLEVPRRQDITGTAEGLVLSVPTTPTISTNFTSNHDGTLHRSPLIPDFERPVLAFRQSTGEEEAYHDPLLGFL